MSRPTLPTIQEIAEALKARTLEVSERYAPGGRVDKGKYWTLNPWRSDSRVGSFYVNLNGAYAGRYHDHASGEDGDMLDLIRNALSCDARTSFAAARQFLGMDDETAEQKALRLRRQDEAKARRARAAQDAEALTRQKRGRAQAMFIQAQAELEGTPVGHYLEGRAIDISALGRTPGSLRYLPQCKYFHTDPETGEYIDTVYPAMIAAIYGPALKDGGPPEFWGVHRTYLAQDAAGKWGKAPVPSPKKVFGSMQGGYIRLWSGIGPRGGKGAPLSKAPDGDHVYISEGLEDALSVAVLYPHARVLCAISLGNIKEVQLPAAITRVTIVADNDDGQEQLRQIDKAQTHFLKQGREVSIWKNTYGGKDLNDALMMIKNQQESTGAV